MLLAEVGEVDGAHVHRDAPDDRHGMAADDRRARRALIGAPEDAQEAVGIAERDDGDAAVAR